jgi:Methyltransferase domain
MKEFIKNLRDRVFRPLAWKTDLDNLYIQISALLEVKEIVGPKALLGPLRGWALSPDALLIVLRDVTARCSPKVIEFGAGESTIAIAGALRNLGSGSLVTVEHDRSFAARILARLERTGLEGFVHLAVLPLRKYEPRPGFQSFFSYDLVGLETDFDVAVVDGPIAIPEFGAGTRFAPVEWCVARLGGERTLYLDDAGRREERAIIDALRSNWRNLDVEDLATEKGMCRLSCRTKSGDEPPMNRPTLLSDDGSGQHIPLAHPPRKVGSALRQHDVNRDQGVFQP